MEIEATPLLTETQIWVNATALLEVLNLTEDVLNGELMDYTQG
jgi:hypothetical protein